MPPMSPMMQPPTSRPCEKPFLLAGSDSSAKIAPGIAPISSANAFAPVDIPISPEKMLAIAPKKSARISPPMNDTQLKAAAGGGGGIGVGSMVIDYLSAQAR